MAIEAETTRVRPSSGPSTVLFLTTVWPAPRRTGGEIVSQAFIDAIRRSGARVLVVAHRRSGERARAGDDDLLAGERPIESSIAGARPLIWMLSAIVRGLPYSAAKYVSRDYRRRLAEGMRERPELVVFDHAQSLWAWSPLSNDTPRIFIAHNVEHQLYGRQMGGMGALRRIAYRREARLVKRLEQRAVEGSRQAWALTDEDAAALQAIGAAAPVKVFMPPPAVRPATLRATRDVVLLGTWTWSANAAGLEWFLAEVVPLLPAAVRVHVGGAGSETIRCDSDRVVLHGRVADAQSFLTSGRVIAIPMTAGAGIQVKTLDAVATGRRVVVTRLGARGLDDLPATVAVADQPVSFARLISDALERFPTSTDLDAAEDWLRRIEGRFGESVRSATTEALADGR